MSYHYMIRFSNENNFLLKVYEYAQNLILTPLTGNIIFIYSTH